MTHAATPARDSDLEARLRQRPGGEGRRCAVGAADWGDLAGRLASSTRRRQRVLAGAAGLALLVGAAGGYFGEAAASPGPLAARRRDQGRQAAVDRRREPTRASAPSASGLATPQICPGVTGGPSGTELGTATRVFIRTTADGVTIRVYQMPSPGVSCIEPPTPLAGAGGTTLPVVVRLVGF